MVRKRLTKAQREERRQLKIAKALEDQKNLYRNQLEREKRFTKTNSDRLEADWQQLMSKLKLPELKNELLALKAETDEMLDRKASYIDGLIQRRQASTKQYNRNIQKHLDIINYIRKLYTMFLNSSENFYKCEVWTLSKKYHIDCLKKQFISDQRDKFYQNIDIQTNLIHTNLLVDKYFEFQVNKEDVICETTEKLDKFRQDISAKMTKSSDEIKLLLENLKNKTSLGKRKDLYEKLLIKDTKDCAEKKQLAIDIVQTQKLINKYKQELMKVEYAFMQQKIDLLYEKNYFTNFVQILRTNFDRITKHDTEQVSVLCSSVEDVLKVLQSIKTKGALLLGVMQVCSKYELEKEKILPWSEGDNNEMLKSDESIFQDLHDLKSMKLFWNKVSKVEGMNHLLKEEKAKLFTENEYLKNQIRFYCDKLATRKIINSLKIDVSHLVTIPAQEASHMVQLKQQLNERK